MINVNISKDQREYAKKLNGQIRQFKTREKWTDNTSAENSYNGFLAEVVICDMFGIKRPEFKPFESDKGYDILIHNLKVDVKNSPSHAINCEQYKKQKEKVDVYLFAITKQNGTVLQIDGWTPYADVKEAQKIKPNRRPPYYKVNKLYLLKVPSANLLSG